MDRDKRDLGTRGVENSVEGKAKEMKGRIKDAVGGLTGDESLQAEGKWDKVKGNVQDKVGEIQRDIDRETRDDKI